MRQRYISVLPPIVILGLDGRPTLRAATKGGPPEPVVITFQQFVASRLRDPVFGASLVNLEICALILLGLSRCSPGDHLVLPEPAWILLARATAEPHQGNQYDSAAGVSVLPFMRAIVGASLEAPVERPAEEESVASAEGEASNSSPAN